MLGLGPALVYSAEHPEDSQFSQWQFYVVLMFIFSTITFQIIYLNRALAQFSTSIVIPIYYVMFTTLTLVCSGVLLGFKKYDSSYGYLPLFVGFLVICCGVGLLFKDVIIKNNDIKIEDAKCRLETANTTSIYVIGAEEDVKFEKQ